MFDFIRESLNQENQDWTNEKPEAEVTPAPTETKEGETPADASTEEKPQEEESRELTLDEWKRRQNTRAKPQYNLRKAGEGEDLSRWKKMYALERKKEGSDEEEEAEEEFDAAAEFPQRAGRQKRVLGIEIQFSDSRRGSGGRGRGGRGGRGERANGRGFGNRGAPRDNDSRGSAVSNNVYQTLRTFYFTLTDNMKQRYRIKCKNIRSNELIVNKSLTVADITERTKVTAWSPKCSKSR